MQGDVQDLCAPRHSRAHPASARRCNSPRPAGGAHRTAPSSSDPFVNLSAVRWHLAVWPYCGFGVQATRDTCAASMQGGREQGRGPATRGEGHAFFAESKGLCLEARAAVHRSAAPGSARAAPAQPAARIGEVVRAGARRRNLCLCNARILHCAGFSSSSESSTSRHRLPSDSCVQMGNCLQTAGQYDDTVDEGMRQEAESVIDNGSRIAGCICMVTCALTRSADACMRAPAASPRSRPPLTAACASGVSSTRALRLRPRRRHAHCSRASTHAGG